MITFVSLSLNEADIAARWARHCFAQGADRVLVADAMSPDGTAEVLRSEGVEVVEDHEPFCYQARIANDLIGTVGAGWIVPADMDEFWIGADGRTVAEVLDGQPESVGTVTATVFNHADWDHRWTAARPLQKVAFRWDEDARVTMGAHDVLGVPGVRAGGLEVRELQFRSAAHFKAKVRDRIATLDPGLLPGDGAHYKRLVGLTDEQLDDEWTALCSHETTYDPIG